MGGSAGRTQSLSVFEQGLEVDFVVPTRATLRPGAAAVSLPELRRLDRG
jgi:hypothetical protein